MSKDHPPGAPAFFLGAKAVFLGARAVLLGAKAFFLGAKAVFLGAKAFVLGAKALFLGAKAFSLGAKAFSLGAKAFSLGAKAFSLGAKAFFLGAKPFFLGAKPFFLGAKPFFLGAKAFFLGAKTVRRALSGGRCLVTHQARGVSQDARAVAGARRRGRPAAFDARGEQLVGARGVVPDGDRRHAAQSGRVVDQEHRLRPADHHVVRVLVLHDHALDEPRRPQREAPPHDVLERPLASDDGLDRGESLGREGCPRFDHDVIVARRVGPRPSEGSVPARSGSKHDPALPSRGKGFRAPAISVTL